MCPIYQLLLARKVVSMLYFQPVMQHYERRTVLGQAKLIHSLSSGVFEKLMRVGGHFSYFIKGLYMHGTTFKKTVAT